MKYDLRSIVIVCLCIFLGIIFIILGVITKEIEISKENNMVIYDNFNIKERK